MPFALRPLLRAY